MARVVKSTATSFQSTLPRGERQHNVKTFIGLDHRFGHQRVDINT